MQSGTTDPRSVRDHNTRLVLQWLRKDRQARSRATIAREMKLTSQTASNIVRRLIEAGLLVEAGKDTHTGGKPGVKFRVNPHGAYAIGVQVDSNNTTTIITTIIMNLLGEVIDSENHHTSLEGPAEVLGYIKEAVERLVGRAVLNTKKIVGLGVAFPGPMNTGTGIVNWIPRRLDPLEKWPKPFALKAELEKLFDYEVTVANDAIASASAEYLAGNATDCDSFCYVYMGAGVGGGLFECASGDRGSVLQGTSVAEIGHISLDPIKGGWCWCGQRGCVEEFAKPQTVRKIVKKGLESGEWKESSLAKAYEEGKDEAVPSFEEICQAADKGDALALWALRDYEYSSANMLGHGIINLLHTTGTELIILGGWGIEQAAHIYQEEVHKVVNKKDGTVYRLRAGEEVPVKLSKFSANGESDPLSGAWGVAYGLLNEHYAPRHRPSWEYHNPGTNSQL